MGDTKSTETLKTRSTTSSPGLNKWRNFLKDRDPGLGSLLDFVIR